MKNRGKVLAVGMTFVLCVACVFTSAAWASTTNTIDLENASINPANWYLTDSAVTYDEKNLDHNNVYAPALSTWTPSGTGHSLKFEHASRSGTDKQRTEYYLAKNLPFYQMTYVGYQFSFSTDFPAPSNWAALTQFYQLGYYNQAPMGVLELSQSSPGKLNFVIRNDEYYSIDGVSSPNGNNLLIWQSPNDLRDGKFHTLVIGFRADPAYTGGRPYGYVRIVLDGVPQTYLNSYDAPNAWAWSGKIGVPAGFHEKSFISSFYTSFGLYRGSQTNNMRVYFDNIKLGTSESDVAP